MKYPVIQLKAGREASVGFHHPWVFSGAIDRVAADVVHGGLVHVADRNGRVIGTGTYSKHTTIAVRVFDFKEVNIDETWLRHALSRSQAKRELLGYGPTTSTTGYRVVFGESDYLPGLVIDRYNDVLVLQISTAGMDALRPLLLSICQELWSPRAIVERSDMASRSEERLEPVITVHSGDVSEAVEFKENDATFFADVATGQKTGFFFDQKDLRKAVATYALGKKVLNLFSYTGSTSIMALLGGAVSVHNVDESESALAMIEKHLQVNNLDSTRSTIQVADVFAWLNTQEKQQYDMVILDPPALMKTQRDKEGASKAYHFLNRAAMRLVKDGGIFVSSSCSRYLSEDDLHFILRRASVQAGVTYDVLESVRQAPDHPLSIYFPESLYLKSCLGIIHY